MKKNLPKIILGALILLIVGFIFYALTRPETATTSSNNNRPKVQADVAKLSQGNAIGPVEAKVVVAEFGDYQCPACGKYHQVLKSGILPAYDGKIRFVFLNYPLPIHKNAQSAAQAAEASALQGKFWQMHDLLYERQQDWSEQKDPYAKFESYAKELGLDIAKFKSDYASQQVADIINNQAALGDAFNVPGTPTFFVNGVQVDNNQGSNALNQAIDKALAQ